MKRISLGRITDLARDSFVYGVSAVLTRFVNVFLIPIYTRVFPPEEYGHIALIVNLMMFLGIISILGLDSALARWYYDSENEIDRQVSINTFLGSGLMLSSSFMVLVALFHRPISRVLLGGDVESSVVLIAALSLPLTVFITFTGNVLRIQRRPVATSVFALTTSLSIVVFSIVFVVYLDFGIPGVFYAQLLAGIIATSLTVWMFRHVISPTAFRWTRWREMFNFSYPLIPANLAFWIVNLSGVYFIGFLSDATEVGLYQIGVLFASSVALATSSFQSAWGPFAFSICNEPGSRRIFAQTLTAYLALTCILAVSLTLFAREILILITTPNYIDAYKVTGLLAFNHVVVGIGYIASIGPSIAKNNKMYGIASIASAGLLITMSFVLIPEYGKEGAAGATLLSQALVPVLVFIHGQRLYRIPYNFQGSAVIFGSALVVSFGTLTVLDLLDLENFVQIVIKVVTGCLFAAVMLFVVWCEMRDTDNSGV